MSIDSTEQITVICPPIVSPDPRFTVTDRQERLPGFNQQALKAARKVLIGAGGLGGEVAEGLVRKAGGEIAIFDHDWVDVTNLNRQFFFEKDIGQPKSFSLAHNLKPHAVNGAVLKAYHLSFEDAVAAGVDLSADVVGCGVDDGETRVAVSKYYLQRKTTVIFIAVDYMAEAGSVFVQEPSGPCFGCLHSKNPYGHKAPCFTPAVKDILKIVAGYALYAVDSLFMERKRNWNYRLTHLAGFAEDDVRLVPRNPNCPLCRHE